MKFMGYAPARRQIPGGIVPKYVWKYARDLFGGLLQVARVSDVVAVQHGAGLKADDIHHHMLWEAGADHIPGCRAPQMGAFPVF
jgi:hypothetical protein